MARSAANSLPQLALLTEVFCAMHGKGAFGPTWENLTCDPRAGSTLAAEASSERVSRERLVNLKTGYATTFVTLQTSLGGTMLSTEGIAVSRRRGVTAADNGWHGRAAVWDPSHDSG